MKQIKTGQGTIPLITLIAILSVSAVTSLPGLAISPILGYLDNIFPKASHLEIQMLTSLPSLLIIPFVIFAGKLAINRGKITIVVVGSAIFVVGGIMCLFAKSIMSLILVSSLIGIGAGMIIPISTGLIADFFVGENRTKMLGISSAITNLTLVLATLLTGWLAHINWHYPFLVYLLPIVTISLAYYLKDSVLKKTNTYYIGAEKKNIAKPETNISSQSMLKDGESINYKELTSLMLLYFFVTYAVIVIMYDLPFLMQSYHFSSSLSGVMISVFFLAIMLPGFFITKIIGRLKSNTISLSLFSIAVGLLLITLSKSVALIAVGAIITGVGYGIIQPIIYDKASLIAKSESVVLALAFVMAVNFFAILVAPFIMNFLSLFFDANSTIFVFRMNFLFTIFVSIFAFTKRDKFVFRS